MRNYFVVQEMLYKDLSIFIKWEINSGENYF